jgi:CelD/BcsL family acetyltransferase involved in cellulose biosynthesis
MPCLETAPATLRLELAASDIRVSVVSTYQAFLNLQSAWDLLADAAKLDHPFLEFEWSRAWFDCCGKGSDLNVLVLYDGREVIAIAPLISTRVRTWGIELRKLGFFYNDHVPRADFLVARGRSSDAYPAIWKHLLENRNWDLLQLCQLPERSETIPQLQALAAGDGCPSDVWASGAAPYVTMSESWGQYYEGLPSKHRSNLRNRFKRLNQAGAVEIEAITAEDDVDGGIRAGLALESAAWKGSAGTAVSSDPALTRFYTTFAECAAKKGWLRLHFLKAGPKRIAFDYSLVYKNRLFLLKLGYDPHFAAYSPSNLLFCLALQGSFERGMAVYDLLGQTADWKRNWTQEAREHYWLYIFPGTLKGRVLFALKFRLVPLLKKTMARGAR